MKIRYYQIDAFTSKVFSGNPAGVCILKEWLPDELLQNIAFENNLSETAFIIDKGEYYELRWFTPTVEVDLCGHATLAPSYLILNFLKPSLNSVSFKTQSGELSAKKTGDKIEINFPSRMPVACSPHPDLISAIGIEPISVYKSRDYLLLFESEEVISSINPNMDKLINLDCLGIIITAVGNKYDFVSRFFAPGAGVPEDPVTGSAHCSLIPFWAERLKKDKMSAKQLSQRGGELLCTNLADRVLMAGNCVIYSKGEILI